MSDSWKKLTRRSFIKGLGGAGIMATTGPLFNELMAHAAGKAPVRVLFVAIQHGWGVGGEHGGRSGNVSEFSGAETSFTLPTTLTPLEAIKNQCVFVDGLRGTFWGNAHDVSYTDLLTAGVPFNASASNFGLQYQFPKSVNASLDAALETFHGKPALRFSAGYSSWGAPHHPLSISSSLNVLPFHTKAVDAYNQIFKNAPAPAVDKVNPRVLAGVSDLTDQLLNKLQGGPRDRLIAYRDAFEEFKKSFTAATGTIASGSAKIEQIPGTNQVLETEVDQFLDMIRVAFTNDTHRVAVLGIGEPQTDITYESSKAGVTTTFREEMKKAASDFHHTIGHYSGQEVGTQGYDASNAKLGFAATRRMYCQKIANFVQKLQSTIDVDGKPLIDNTVIVLTGEVATGEHNTVDKMHIVIGGGGGAIRRGRWLKVPNQTTFSTPHVDISGSSITANIPTWMAGEISSRSHADLLTAIANMVGLNVTTFGISRLNKGPLDLS